MHKRKRRQWPWLLSELRPGMEVKHTPSGAIAKIAVHPKNPRRTVSAGGWGIRMVLQSGHVLKGGFWDLRDVTVDGRPVVPTKADLRPGVDPSKLHCDRVVWSQSGRRAEIAGEVTEQGRMGGAVDRLFVRVRIRNSRGRARLVEWSLKHIRLSPPRAQHAA